MMMTIYKIKAEKGRERERETETEREMEAKGVLAKDECVGDAEVLGRERGKGDTTEQMIVTEGGGREFLTGYFLPLLALPFQTRE